MSVRLLKDGDKVEEACDKDEELTEDALDDQGVSWVGADVLADRVPSRIFVYNGLVP